MTGGEDTTVPCPHCKAEAGKPCKNECPAKGGE